MSAGVPSAGGGSPVPTDGLAVALFPLLVIWYLNNTDVKATFGMESLR